MSTFPPELKYSKDHEWIRLEGEFATVGITDFAQSELGDIVYVDVDTEGDVVEANEVFGSVEAVKTVSDLFMPIDAEVIELNPALEDDPELVNTDPYNKGWIIKIKPQNLDQLNDLLDHESYKKLVGAV